MFLCVPLLSFQPQLLYVIFSFKDRLQYQHTGRKPTARNPTQFYRAISQKHAYIYLWIFPAYDNPVNSRPRKLQLCVTSLDVDLLYQIIPNLKQVNFQEVFMSALSIRDMVIL